MRLANRLAMRRVRAGRTFIAGMNGLILTTVGRRTGAERQSPLSWFPGPDGSWLIVASAGGAPGNPAWYYNLKANPERVRITVAGDTIDVTAAQLHGAELAAAWETIVAAAPRFAEYRARTDREIPVIGLSRR
ncbi:nitroreductase [Paractinoplanes rishiriensis]|uniref:Nitroreductase n=1 Tax=Paractinoplanes rishiriensis TaxID=1050105 RepID=A0A919MYY4_9ACTN|nr:nitroreductase [Actinoplanes rishiriensis]